MIILRLWTITRCINLRHCKQHSYEAPSLAAYSINNILLQSVDQHKYLGVLLHNSMSWTKHIQEVINKASKTLNFVKRTLYQCEPSVKGDRYWNMLYSFIWDPHQQYLIDNIEMVQREQLGGLNKIID